MLENPQRYTVTAALIYANGPIHIGHLAGCYIPADIYVRYLRSTGRDVAFISGTDEHGVPITIKAKKEGITPQAGCRQILHADQGLIRAVWYLVRYLFADVEQGASRDVAGILYHVV